MFINGNKMKFLFELIIDFIVLNDDMRFIISIRLLNKIKIY